MKTLTFRPLRLAKSLNKIVVASYNQWSKVRTADYDRFNLVIDDEYRSLCGNAQVYNHKGEELFWRDYDPSNISVFNWRLPFDEMRAMNPNFASSSDGYVSYFANGLDCNGTPTFSHGTIKNIINGYPSVSKINEHELLTVAMVVKWYGWFLLNLKNSSIQIRE